MFSTFYGFFSVCTYCTYNVHIQGPRKLSCIFEQYLFHAILLHSRVECFFLFQNFGVRAIARWSKFSFSKNFDANLHEASFYIKEQTHKYKFEITFVDLLFLKLKQKKNMKTTFFRFLFQKLKMPFWGGQPIFFF